MNYSGVIIEESLEEKSVLQEVHILSTSVEQVTEQHKTPWLKQWTLHTVEISEGQAKDVAEKISHAIDQQHASAWYANFLNDFFQYVVFRDKVFEVDRSKPEQYVAVKSYGRSLGIPEHQLDIPL